MGMRQVHVTLWRALDNTRTGVLSNWQGRFTGMLPGDKL